jgi:6-phosphofructokinase 1
MGRDSGYIAIDTGIGGGAEAILIPEIHTNLDKLIQSIRNEWGRKKSSQLVVVAEGDDAGGVFHIMEEVKTHIKGLDCRAVVLGHIQRGGSPSAADRVLASRLGAAAVTALIKGYTHHAIGLTHNNIEYCSLADAVSNKKAVNRDLLTLSEILSI